MNEKIDDLDGDPERELYHDAEAEGPGEDAPVPEDEDAGTTATEEQTGGGAEREAADG